jgi:hypothetical protein
MNSFGACHSQNLAREHRLVVFMTSRITPCEQLVEMVQYTESYLTLWP